MPKAPKGPPKGLTPGQVLGLNGPAGKVANIKPGTHHRHGCEQCGLRYDDACQTPDVNGVCVACRTGRERVLWLVGGDPQQCCRAEGGCRVMTYDARMKYACATDLTWYQCKTCARTHPFNPFTPEGVTA